MFAAILVILNLILIEAILSIDNAAVLATMVKHLPKKQQKQAMTWGIWGAYLLRGACLIFAAWLVSFMWLKIIGGVYLLYLAYKELNKGEEEEQEIKKLDNKSFWKLIIAIEIMDLTFSIDNVFAAVALSNNIYIVMAGCFIGILAMRFAATYFVKLLAKYPSLGRVVLYIIALLGIRLIVDGALAYLPHTSFSDVLHHEYTDLVFSGIVLGSFLLPIIFGKKNELSTTIEG